MSCFYSGISGFVKVFCIYFQEPFFACLKWRKKRTTFLHQMAESLTSHSGQNFESLHVLRLSEASFVNRALSVRSANVARGDGRKTTLMTPFRNAYTSWICISFFPANLALLINTVDVILSFRKRFQFVELQGWGFPFIFLFRI